MTILFMYNFCNISNEFPTIFLSVIFSLSWISEENLEKYQDLKRD